MGRLDEAEGYFTESYETLLAAFGPDDVRTTEAREALRSHLSGRGMTDRASALGR